MLDFSQPYYSTRSPVCARNVVCSSQPLATQAGINILRNGGNAIDAAIASAIALTVVEPSNNGVGGDAFAIIWNGKKLQGLNASGRAPAGWNPERFTGRTKMPALGWESVTVPGAVSAWIGLSERYGSLPFVDLFADAIGYATDGFHVGPYTAAGWAISAEVYAHYDDWLEHFSPTPTPGTLFKRPALANTLEEIARTGGESLYRGALAAQIVQASDAAGGCLSLEDLDAHQADWVTPIGQPYRQVELHEIPPNGQGLAAQIALGILRHLEPTDVDHADGVHVQIEAMKIAIRAAFDHFADPQAMDMTPEALLDDASLQRAAARIGSQASPLPPAALPTSRDTVYLCAADADGNMISLIQSNYMGFGSGIVIPGTGIAMQNRGRGFSLAAGHPNEVGPHKRPFHTIIPGFVTRDGAPQMAFGVMGGHMQHQGHVQMMQRIFDHGQNPQAASDAPRWMVQPDFSVVLEPACKRTLLDGLRARGHEVAYEPQPVFGGAQLIYRTADGYIAGSDHRKEGQAAGF